MISLIIFTLLGCSGIKRAGRSAADISGGGDFTSDEILKSRNLTNNNFFIQKAEVEISTEEISGKFIASIKFVVPDQFLISIRSRTGIEVARMFLSDDTVLINDRINRKLYHGDPEFVNIKYGIPVDIMPILLGDYVSGNEQDSKPEKCSGGLTKLGSTVKGLKVNYTVDCRKAKIVKAEQEGSMSNIISEIEYDDFERIGNIIMPAFIKIRHMRTMSNLILRIGKIESPWVGSIDFIPGSRYELIELR